ncbi:YeeE/YedE thiosulfate transporter family protein [Streptobacillus felis]|uniref:YeeE/YedE family protein n=1 Tax=Streptobacillus felis TaxID=1384509 RepID=A0A7Z0PE34_9FUSO|nr:YeeE/YedE thiosulfate transporter family protein [Streptobacillus felis]NYV27329.1 YeeE/YedE family protein [Streptobacillus felis]
MQAYFKKLQKNPIYKRIMKDPLSYNTGATLLAVFAIAHFIFFDKTWGVTSTFAVWGAKVFRLLGATPENWVYFQTHASQGKAILTPLLQDGGSIRNIGIIFGATLATLFASEFRIKKIRNKKQVVAGMLGGFLMGFGARLALGCNIGALFSATAALSLSGWVFAAFLLVGAIIGSKLLVKVFM